MFVRLNPVQETGRCDGEHDYDWRQCPGKDSAMGCYREGEKVKDIICYFVLCDFTLFVVF